MRSFVRIVLLGLVVALCVSAASVAVAAPQIKIGFGYTDGPHNSYPGLCTGCHTFQTWPAPAITSGAIPTHGPRGTTCTQCHTITAPPQITPGLGYTDGPHTAYPGLCTGCHTFQTWPAPAIPTGALPAHNPRGTTCTQCHTVTPPPPADIATPTASAADVSGSVITVGWLPVSGAVSYNVYRATSPTGTFAQVGSTAGLTFTNTGCSAGVRYYYKVRGVDTNGLLGPLCDPLAARTVPATAIRVDSSLSQLSTTGTGWRTVSGTRYVGGSTRYSAAPGNKITIPFRGTAVTWYGTRGKAFGKAAVYIDGVRVKIVDTYYARTLYDRALFTKTGLADKAHTLTIVVSSSKNVRATGRRVDVDAFKFTGITPGLNQEETKAKFTGVWTAKSSTNYSGSAARTSAESTASVSYTFRGTGVTYLGTKAATHGKAAVYVDGVSKGTVDLWSASVAYRRPMFTIAGLAKTTHTLRIVPVGSCGPISTGNGIDVDAFVTR